MIDMIAGVDEVGVGPIAGPVIAAAVLLNPKNTVYKLRDSKMLTQAQREILYDRIMTKALAVSIGAASVDEIDRLNIFHATMLAMQRAIEGLVLLPSLVLIDGRNSPKVNVPIKTVIRGDQTEKSISAASIIAKVTRDRLMTDFHQQFPQYHFDKHKGYSTKKHHEAIWQYGICHLHRRSFTFVKTYLQKQIIK